MCGKAGVLDLGRSTGGQELGQIAANMAGALEHRGPDDAGLWSDDAGGVALGHRRLAVIDRSSAGSQPMSSASGRYVISYNGEIYNFMALRGELEREGIRFRGHCDTEVLLAGIEAWGARAMLHRCNGMFAFALWDRHERTLVLARDRLGEKPLYYGMLGAHLAFASELEGIRRHPAFRARIDSSALAAYFRYGYVPAPLSIQEGVRKLGAGELLSVGAEDRRLPRPEPWWSLADVAQGGGQSRRFQSEDVDELEELLGDAVALRLRADVPVGAFLSGGVDSSTLLALMQRAGGGAARSFTVGFEHAHLDESRDAALVAAHLGADHTELRLGAGDALAAARELPGVCDEPFADPAALPTLLVSRLARQDVTVAFAGDGGDELFHGYARYGWATRLWRAMAPFPPGLRRRVAMLGTRLPLAPLNRLGSVLPGERQILVGDLLRKLAALAALPDRDRLYEGLMAWWPDPPVRHAGSGLNPAFARIGRLLPASDPGERMRLIDSLTYLPDDILTKVDRTTMSVGLEARVPMLDHRVVELAWRVSPFDARRPGPSKPLLRQVLYRYLPRQLADKPKQGFEVPIAEWLRGPLRPWAEELLAPERLAAQGLLDHTTIVRHWREHLSGRRNWHYRLWSVLMFQAWLAHRNEG